MNFLDKAVGFSIVMVAFGVTILIIKYAQVL